jgi:N-acyl-D-aspartate/D-glutamate deacylase
VKYDLVLCGGVVIDGTGAEPHPGDVAVTGSKVVYVGEGLDVEDLDSARLVIDATGLAVAPGFIDIHTHSDLSVVQDPRCESKILQGVTTEVVGNCGFSPFPSSTAGRAGLLDHLGRLGHGSEPVCWASFHEFTEAVGQDPPALNVVALVGHGALRIAAMADPFGTSSETEIARMEQLLAEALDQGAWGFSTGLTHTPSSLADEEEIRRLVAVCASHGALYATHARVFAGQSFAAVEEAVRTSQEMGARLQYSHIALHEPKDWGRAADVLAIFEAAEAEGLNVGFDLYPYTASSSDLLQYLPAWAQEGGSAQVARNNLDPTWRRSVLDELRNGWFGGIPWHWDRVVVASAGQSTGEVGLSVDQVSKKRNVRPEEVLLDLCAEAGSPASAVLHYRTEEDMAQFLRHRLSVVGSDGLAISLGPSANRPHPRSFGTFPRVLGRYARDGGELPLAVAVHKMTEGPAKRLGLQDRGVLRASYAADIVVFDPERVIDTATFEEPRQAPAGIEFVIVNGQVVVRDGRQNGGGAGRLLRRPR